MGLLAVGVGAVAGAALGATAALGTAALGTAAATMEENEVATSAAEAGLVVMTVVLEARRVVLEARRCTRPRTVLPQVR